MKIYLLTIGALPLAFAATGSFSYKPDSDKGPTSWGSLDLGPDVDNQCGGSSQSGIDVPTSSCGTTGDYSFSPGSCSLDDIKFKINDHTIIAEYDTEGGCALPRMIIPGKSIPYDIIQFHMHAGSDHAIDGRYFGADLHLVHKEVGGDSLSVLGLFLEPTDPDGLAKFSDLLAEWEKIPLETEASCSVNGTINSNATAVDSGGMRRAAKLEQGTRKLRAFNPYDLVPEGATMYTYQGSLTTPPCLEIVFWNVVDTPVSISPLEFLRMVNLIIDYVSPESCEKATIAAESGFTGRPVQPINGREITRICPNGFVDPLAEKSASPSEADEEEEEETPASTQSKNSGAMGAYALTGLTLAVVSSIL